MFPSTAACPLCQSNGAERIFFSRDRVSGRPEIFGLYHCAFCDAIFIQPWLNDAELARYYPENYGGFRHSRSLNRKNYVGWQRFVLENYYGYPSSRGSVSPNFISGLLAWLLAFVTAKSVIPYRGSGRIPDVGCGAGSYLYRLRNWGWDGYGVEPSETAFKQAQSLGLAVRHGILVDAQFENEFFDVVRLDNVLEHLRDPLPTFREIHRIVKADGLVYVIVPNTRSLVFWLFQDDWYALETPRHVISYCPRTIEVLCQAAGFEIVEMSYNSGPFNFVRSIKYFFEEKGKGWPRWLRGVRWDRSKLLRRSLKPFFFLFDKAGYGDFLHVTLRKKTA